MAWRRGLRRLSSARAFFALPLALMIALVGAAPASAGDGVWTKVALGPVSADAGVDLGNGPPTVHPTNGRYWLYGTGGGLYRSADGGATWKRAVEVEGGVYFTQIRYDPTSASIAYATTDITRG